MILLGWRILYIDLFGLISLPLLLLSNPIRLHSSSEIPVPHQSCIFICYIHLFYWHFPFRWICFGFDGVHLNTLIFSVAVIEHFFHVFAQSWSGNFDFTCLRSVLIPFLYSSSWACTSKFCDSLIFFSLEFLALRMFIFLILLSVVS